MSVYKEERGTWRCLFRYKDYQGNVKQGQKRGFKTRREALEYEREFLAKSSFNNTMTFQSLYELYIEDMRSRLKENTILSKKHIIEVKILPFFQKLTLDKITPVTIRKWQNGLLEYKNKTGESYSQTYIKSINNQLVAIFNYAVKYHSMKENPCHKAGNIGKKHADEMKIWTVEEFNKFIYELKHKPVQYTGFNILFWCGLRIGELLALSIKDIDFENKKININKSYQRINGKDVITEPKTPKSKRKIDITDNLAIIIKEYISKLYNATPETRLFNHTKYIFEHDIKTYSKKAEIKRIRVHDLRHSHASFLFQSGIDPLTIFQRLGHEKIETTLNTYTHLYEEASSKLLRVLNKSHGNILATKEEKNGKK